MVPGHERVMESLYASLAVELHDSLQNEAKVQTGSGVNQHVVVLLPDGGTVARSLGQCSTPEAMNSRCSAEVQESHEAPAAARHYMRTRHRLRCGVCRVTAVNG